MVRRAGGRDVGLEHLTLLELAPPGFVSVAAAAGFNVVGLRVSPVTDAERAWPMGPGSAMLAETADRCARTGIAVLGVEAIHPGARAQDAEPVLETAAALGARYATVLCEDPDVDRFADRFAALTELARPYRVRPVVEFMAFRPLRTLEETLAVVRRSGGGGLLLDTLHIQRCGVSAADLARTDPGVLSYLQICDAPTHPAADAITEARAQRLLPGEGNLPLSGMVAALPEILPVSVEAPNPAGRKDPAGYARRARLAAECLLREMVLCAPWCSTGHRARCA